ncbi:MAG: DUF3089 domain-containing protein [Oceanicoccus sp.]
MLKKMLIATGLIILILVAVAYFARDSLMLFAMKTAVGPDHNFDTALVPPAPDYSMPAAWAAWPGKKSPVNSRPLSADIFSKPSDVNVFFVHPTSYLKKDNWNQPLTDEDANWIVDHRVLRHQASVFNSCCDIYAPRYRQATFFSFMDKQGNGEKALEIAYRDVATAFDEFLSQLNPDQAFILAGHSQGTLHSTRLLREKIAGTNLQERMVAAYLVGFSVTEEQLGDVPVCATATDTGCAVGWNAMEGNSQGLFPQLETVICVNPLLWNESGEYADHTLNQGSIGYPSYSRAKDDEDYTAMKLEPGAADAQCINNGMLSVGELKSESFPSRMPGDSMHIYDYSLFHMNIRNNVHDRIANYPSK